MDKEIEKLFSDFHCENCNTEYRSFSFAQPENNWCFECRKTYAVCGECSKVFERLKGVDGFCGPECKSANWKREAQSRADIWWNSVCPPLFRKTDIGRLPNRGQSSRVLMWKYGERGLIMFGKSGAGKTRTTYLLLRDLVYNGYTVELLRGVDFQAQVIERTKPGGIGSFTEWFSELVDVDVLAFDDFDKTKFTPRVEAEAYNLIDVRLSYCRPIIISANASSGALARKLSEETGGPIIRRIKEACEPINFDVVADVSK